MTTEQTTVKTEHDLTHGDPLAEIRKVRDTAERMANGENQPEADQLRVVAGMVHLLAEQVERLLDPPDEGPRVPERRTGVSTTDDAPSARADIDRERALEEDLTPEDPPAEPALDRTR